MAKTKFMKGRLFAKSIVPVILAALTILWLADSLHADEPVTASAHKIKIILVGDSTMTDHAGWGLGFKQFLGTNAECINTARGGRSSMSYMKEGLWTNALAMKGDYYLIQFGHNNEPGKPGRSTDMPTFVSDMTRYVDETLAIGAKPILITPLCRRQWDKANPTKIKSSLVPYAEEVRKIAAAKHIPLLELHDRARDLYESIGKEKCQEFSPVKVTDGTNVFDGTHLLANGSVMFARIIVDELHQKVPALNAAFRADPPVSNAVAGETSFDAVVTPDGSGTQTTVQKAIEAAPADSTNAFVVLIEPGVYQGQIVVPKEKRHLKFIGESPENTVLTYAFNVIEPPPQETQPKYKGTGVVILADDFYARQITFQNTSGDHGQALALRVDGDRAVFNQCRMLGWQDTLMINQGRQYFTNCYVAGRVDFIYGSAAAVFDHCEIHSKNGGHITAANTPADHPYGFVFMNCKLTGDLQPWVSPDGVPANTNSPPKADLGRPWRPYASVTYLNCELGAHIKPEGWNNWRNAENEKTARYAEYNSTGPGANPEARFKWAKQLTREDADKITLESVLGGTDNWKPHD